MFELTSFLKERQKALVIAGLVLLFLFGATVWPTLYRYDHITAGYSRPVRIHRLTGQAEQLTLQGWRRMAPAPVEPLSGAALAEQVRLARQKVAMDEPNDWITVSRPKAPPPPKGFVLDETAPAKSVWDDAERELREADKTK